MLLVHFGWMMSTWFVSSLLFGVLPSAIHFVEWSSSGMRWHHSETDWNVLERFQNINFRRSLTLLIFNCSMIDFELLTEQRQAFFWTIFRIIYQLRIGGFLSFGLNSLSFLLKFLSFSQNPWVFSQKPLSFITRVVVLEGTLSFMPVFFLNFPQFHEFR